MSPNRERAAKTDDDGWSVAKSRTYRGAGAVLAASMVAVILPMTNSMTEDASSDLEVESSQQAAYGLGYDDVDPAFALDGSPFFIEPAAGPPDAMEDQPCLEPVDQQIACDQPFFDRDP